MSDALDARTLGQLIALHELLQVAPSMTVLAEVLASGVGRLPGVKGARVDLAEGEEPPAGALAVAIETPRRRYGRLVVEVTDEAAYAPFAPYVQNLARSAAYLLENERQHAALHDTLARLEVAIQRRTAQLEHSNQKLREEVAERTRAQVALAEANEALERHVRDLEVAERSIASFSYAVSHELRTPLRAVDGFAALLAQDLAGRLDAGAGDHLRRIRAANRRMAKLLDEMHRVMAVSFAALHPAATDLAALARDAFEDLRARRTERVAELLTPASLPVLADRALLRLALEERLGSAWCATHACPRARLEVGEETRDGARTFFVRDNGHPLPPAGAERLFEPFWRVREGPDAGDAGAGLAIAESIVLRHGGRLWADPDDTEGVTLRFTLGG